MLVRPAICALALLTASTASPAGQAPAQPFIERALVIAPHRVGEFVLQGSHYDPANRFAGVSLRYALPGRDETRIDLFVYPIGQGGIEELLDRGMLDFRATLDAAQQAGYYRGLTVAEAVEFDIPLAPPAADGDGAGDAVAAPLQAPAAVDGDGDGEDGDGDGDGDAEARIAMLAPLLGADRRIDGRMLELAYEYPGQAQDEWLPMHSRGYLLHRHLHFFKGRVSAAASRIDHATFAALADRAMHELVPAVQAYNLGSCGDTTIEVDVELSEREMGDMLMRQLVAAQVRSDASNCRRQADDAELAALSRDAEVVVIEYAADDWQGN